MITQLGYDAEKYRELAQLKELLKVEQPLRGSVYVLTPGAARVMNKGKVPGAVVTTPLLLTVQK